MHKRSKNLKATVEALDEHLAQTLLKQNVDASCFFWEQTRISSIRTNLEGVLQDCLLESALAHLFFSIIHLWTRMFFKLPQMFCCVHSCTSCVCLMR